MSSGTNNSSATGIPSGDDITQLNQLLNSLTKSTDISKTVLDEELKERYRKVTEFNEEYYDAKTKRFNDNLNTMTANTKNATNTVLANSTANLPMILLEPTITSIKDTVTSLSEDQNTSTLQTHYLENVSRQLIASQIRSIPNYEDLKLNIELTLYVSKIVFKLVRKKNINIDNEMFITNILDDVFVLNDFERKLILGQIKFLMDNIHLINPKTKWFGIF